MPRSPRVLIAEAEREFPVRVRVAVPANGFGEQLETMYAWLDESCGADSWRSAPSGMRGVVNDAVAFYFMDATLAAAFVNRFCCGVIIETADGAYTVREDAPLRRSDLPNYGWR